jgi:hypothetical protein
MIRKEELAAAYHDDCSHNPSAEDVNNVRDTLSYWRGH